MSQIHHQSGGSEIRLSFVGLTDFSDYGLPDALTVAQTSQGEQIGNAVLRLIDSGLQSGLIAPIAIPEQPTPHITLSLFVPKSSTMPPAVWVLPRLRESLLRLLQEARSGSLVHP